MTKSPRNNLTQPVLPRMAGQNGQRIRSKEPKPPQNAPELARSPSNRLPTSSDEPSKIETMRSMLKHEEYSGEKHRKDDTSMGSAEKNY